MRHFIITSMGTDGDVFPCLGLGAELKRRGHRVTAVLSDVYESLAKQHGFEFASLAPAEETERLLANPDFWHPIKTVKIVSQWGLPYIQKQYELLARLAGEGDSVIVAAPAILAARLVQEKLGTPLASVLLQPWLIPSNIAPPTMPARLTLPRWAPPPLKWMYWRGLDAVGDRLIGGKLNELRSSIGLPRMRRIFRWWLSPQLAVGMFPPWYGLPQRDWSPQIRLTDFPMYDGKPAAVVSPELVQFCQAGAPPIAFTFGTGMMHAVKLFRAAVESCVKLGRRGLLLSKYADKLPANLPSCIRHVEYAPFQKLFPLCAAVVHHGGIGTTAKALAAGTPQLVVPLAFDQLDNALRVKRMGAGNFIKPKGLTSVRLAGALAPLLEEPARRCSSAVRLRMQNQPDGLGAAADLVSALAGCQGSA